MPCKNGDYDKKCNVNMIEIVAPLVMQEMGLEPVTAEMPQTLILSELPVFTALLTVSDMEQKYQIWNKNTIYGVQMQHETQHELFKRIVFDFRTHFAVPICFLTSGKILLIE